MPVVRPIQPLPIKLPGLSVSSYGTATARPIGISADRKTFYGSARSTTLYQSINDGTSWTVVNSTAFTDYVIGLIETDDGEALCFTENGSDVNGYVYKSSGWATSHTAATWTKTLTTAGGYIRPYWGGGHTWSMGNDKIRAGTSKYIVVSEYGLGTTSAGLPASAATRVYFSSDYGASFAQVLDLKTRYPSDGTNLHVHASAYDPYWDRIWVSFNDSNATGPDGNQYATLLYSDDHGITWAAVPAGSELGGIATDPAGLFPTGIALFRDRIILGSDNQPGFLTIERKGYRVMGDPQIAAVMAGQTGGQMIALGLHKNRNAPGAPLLLGVQSNSGFAPDPIIAALYVSFDDGATIQHVWSDPLLAGGPSGPETMFGPSVNGKIIAAVIKSGSNIWWNLIGELIVPDENMVDGTGTITGDGTTVAFSFAHGLPYTPLRYLGWVEKVGGNPTVTVTATNVVFTFATAPANGASIPVQWRVA